MAGDRIVARAIVVLGEPAFGDRHADPVREEEEHFLPRAEAALSRDDLAALDSELFAETDPLMDPDTEARYATLRTAILTWEAEAHG